jgi:4-hydroxy-4-methyl-2-oxoglutarate aldolase
MFGELLATSLMQRGVSALIIDAGVRDTSELRQMGFAVWSQYVSCQGTVKASPGSVNVPIVLGRQIVNPGDVVVADDDGVVIVIREDAAAVLDLSRDRETKEADTRRRLGAGELGVDIYGLRSALNSLGVSYVD